MKPDKNEMRSFSAVERLLVLLCFCVCLSGALLLPTDACPDEAGRIFLSDWIVRTGTLPTGSEMQTMLMSWEDPCAPTLQIRADAEADGWGFSYALRPYLSAIVGAGFQKLVSRFTASPRLLLAASRMCSVLSVTFCCVFCLLLGRRLFKHRSSALVFALIVCFLPQVLFLGMYQNNDALSLCAVSMLLYCFVRGCDSGWTVKSCIGLALGFSLCLLSYYSAYGWLLMTAVFCVAAVVTDPDIEGKGRLIAKRAALILGVCALLAGWFFVRNALLHDGDFLGIASEAVSRSRMRALGYSLHDYVRLRDEGLSIGDFLRYGDRYWLRLSAMSFVGVFGYMDILMPTPLYRCYAGVFAGGALLFLAALLRRRPERRDGLLMLLMLASSAITVFLHFWQSYARDFQPQGRYVITLALPLAYLLAYGLDALPLRGKTRALSAALLTAGWLGLFVWAAVGTMTKMLP